jgi:hypothetical protein
MKKTVKRPKGSDELRPEYDFGSLKARPNPFASRMQGPVVAVVLEPDVAEVFDSAESVNLLLRSVISAMPHDVRRSASTKPRRKAG